MTKVVNLVNELFRFLSLETLAILKLVVSLCAILQLPELSSQRANVRALLLLLPQSLVLLPRTRRNLLLFLNLPISDNNNHNKRRSISKSRRRMSRMFKLRILKLLKSVQHKWNWTLKLSLVLKPCKLTSYNKLNSLNSGVINKVDLDSSHLNHKSTFLLRTINLLLFPTWVSLELNLPSYLLSNLSLPLFRTLPSLILTSNNNRTTLTTRIKSILSPSSNSLDNVNSV